MFLLLTIGAFCMGVIQFRMRAALVARFCERW